MNGEKNSPDRIFRADEYRLPPLLPGRLIRRYKRFLADVSLDSGETVTAHCPNSGSMKGCAVEGARAWLSVSSNPKRKYPHTWELTRVGQTYIGINTLVPNRLVKQAASAGMIPDLAGYDRVRSEVKTSDGTRLDLVLEGGGRRTCYVEIKNCTLVEQGRALFPDAVTTRGQKHLDELSDLARQGNRAVIFYLIQRTDARTFCPADAIDPVYGRKLRSAVEKGVELLAMDTCISPLVIALNGRIPARL